MDFFNALQTVFKNEGGFSNDPADRGGVTNFGISQKANPDIDVANLTKDKAAEIYKTRYWNQIGADSLPDNMKVIALDTAVNHGVGAAKKMIEASGGDPAKILQSRADLYKSIIANDPSQQNFANGWNNRLSGLATALDAPSQANNTQASSPQSQLSQQVTAMASQKLGSNFILSKLSDAGHGEEIAYAQKQGYSPDEIVAKFGGEPYAAFTAANAKIDAQGFGTNVVKGVGQAVSDVGTGAQQIAATVTGNDARLQQLNAEEAKRQADPEYQAQQATAGSQIGSIATKAIPTVGAALLSGGSSIPMQIAAQGSAGLLSGAFKPTTADGQRMGNMIEEGAWNAAGGGGGAVAGKYGTKMVGKLLGSTPEDAAHIAQLTADAKAQGLPVNAATLSKPDSFLRNFSEGSSAGGAFQAKADQAIAGKVAEGLGLNGYGGAIDTEMLQAAKPGIKQALDTATNVKVTLPATLENDLAPILAGTNNPLTAGITSNSTVKQAIDNLVAASKSGQQVNGIQLQELNSELKALTQNISASAGERQAAGQMVGKVNDALTSAMTPEQQAAYATANKQYANMMAVQKMVSASGDTGVVTPRQMINAVKTGRFKNAFYSGDAPFQELAGTAADLYGPSSGKGLGAMLAKAGNGAGDHSLLAASIFAPTHALPALAAKKAASYLMNKAATSESPAMIDLLTGGGKLGNLASNPAMRAYIAKALGASGAIAAQE